MYVVYSNEQKGDYIRGAFSRNLKRTAGRFTKNRRDGHVEMGLQELVYR